MIIPIPSRNPVSFLVVLLIVLMMAGIVSIVFMYMAEHRTPSEQMGDAIHRLSDDVRSAARTFKEQNAADKARNDVRRIGDQLHDSAD